MDGINTASMNQPDVSCIQLISKPHANTRVISSSNHSTWFRCEPLFVGLSVLCWQSAKQMLLNSAVSFGQVTDYAAPPLHWPFGIVHIVIMRYRLCCPLMQVL